MKHLGGNNAALIQKLDEPHAAQAKEARAYIADIKAKLAEVPASTEAPLRELRPAFAPSGVTTLNPYYLLLYDSGGGVIWQGNYSGRATLWDECWGSGSGIFGTGVCEGTFSAEWWFYHYTDVSRYYSYTINVPFDGYYIVYADDGFFTSKEAQVNLDVATVGYQYGYKASSEVNVLHYDGQNINVANRYDNVYTTYYGDLLGGPDIAYLRVTALMYVYARGDGSHAELNFADGTANYLDPPWVYIS